VLRSWYLLVGISFLGQCSRLTVTGPCAGDGGKARGSGPRLVLVLPYLLAGFPVSDHMDRKLWLSGVQGWRGLTRKFGTPQMQIWE
jgi:hypothetical protein